MRKAFGLTAAALTTAGFAATATPAMAATPAPSAKVISVSPAELRGDQVYVAGSYRCTGKYHHLWVSVKQGPGDLTQEGSSSIAKSWYDRTYDNTMAPDSTVKCDGRTHAVLARLLHQKGRQVWKGRVYLQFCLLAGNAANGSDAVLGSNQHYRQAIRVA
jgi:hypothetical protein